MALVENAVSAVTIALPEWLTDRVLKEGQIVFVRGPGTFKGGDGVTVGGIDLGTGGGGGGGGDAIAFRTIAVTGAAPELWINADQINDTLTLTPLRGMVISPIPGSDTIGIGLPDGGTFGNVPTWVGTTYAPQPIPPAVYQPQPGDIPVDYLAEGQRKVWDGYIPLSTYLPLTNPASVVYHNGVGFPSLGATATQLLRAMQRIPLNDFDALSIVIRGQCTAATGDASMVARLSVVTNITSAPVWEDDGLNTVTVPGTVGPFDMEIMLDDIGAATQDSHVLLEFGRLGADGADTCAGSIIVGDAFLRLM